MKLASDSVTNRVLHDGRISQAIMRDSFAAFARLSSSKQYRPFICLLGTLLVATLSMPLRGEVDISESLKSIRHSQWYDSTTGEYKTPEYTPIGDVELRKSDWKAKVAPPKSTTPAKSSNWNPNFSWSFDFLSNAFTILVILLLAIGVVAVVLYALRYQNEGTGRSRKQTKSKKITVDAARMVDLPFNVDEAPSDPLEACKRLMNAQNFNRAILYLYSYELLALEQSSLIRLSKGKTNRMYLRELGHRTTLAKILSQTIHCFEAVYFGKHQLTSEQFHRVWNQLDDFHHQIELEGQRRNESKVTDQGAVVQGGATA